MLASSRRSGASFSWRELRLPLVVTLVVSGLAGLGASWVAGQVRQLEAARFQRLGVSTARAIQDAFRPTEQALMSLAGLAVNTDYTPNAAQWSTHVRQVQPYLGRGLIGMGLIRRVPRAAADEIEARMRSHGYAGAVVEREGVHDHLYVVTNNAPLPLNADALGQDIADGTTRREAAEAAMRTGTFELSRQIRVIRGEERSPGVLLFHPVYENGALPPPEEREEALIGWVYVSLDPKGLLAHVTGVVGGQLALQVFQGEELDPTALLFTSHPDPQPQSRTFVQTMPLVQYGQPWTLWLGTTPLFDEAGRNRVAAGVLTGGLIVAALAGGLTWALGTARRRALRLAERITADLKRTEREARRLALVASRTASAVILADSDWRIDWVNDGFTRLTGYTLAEVKGRRPAEILMGPQSNLQTQRAIEEADARGEPFNGELLNYRKDGTTFWVEIEIRPLLDEENRRVGYMALQLDVTDRKRITAELARRMAEVQRLALVASRTASSVVIMDPHWRIEWVNSSFTRLFGYTLEEVQGRRPSQILHGPLTSEETVRALDLADERDELFKGEIVNYTKDRRPLWVRLEVQPLFDDERQKLGYLGLHLDITELKRQAAELLAAKDAAEQANLAKSQFLAMMSHEIRTPMNGVIGMTSLLLDSPLAADQREYVETIRRSGDALLTIINEILDFSKIESGRLELEDGQFSIRACVEGALDLVGPFAAEKAIDLLYELAPEVPDLVRGDASRLRQILVNLLSNAVKFTDVGEVVLSVRRGWVREGEGEIQFAVSDTGIGIPADALSRLFQSFTQVDASTTRRFGGTGLGLAISKRLAEMMGGRMWVESRPGTGSTFSFTVRLPHDPAAQPPPADERSEDFSGQRLLLVDDSATSRRIVCELADRWGLEHKAAGSAEEALAWLDRGGRCDVALIDLHLQGPDGLLLADEIRRRPAGEGLPLILVTAFGRHHQIPQRQRFAALLARPIKPRQLFETLQRVLTAASRPLRPSSGQTAFPVPLTRREHVLVAEDNLVNQKVALHMLERLGYRADVAADGHEVLAALRRQRYDIVLMDVQMPHMDGLEATREFRRWTDLPVRPWVIAITANAMHGDREICLKAGMDDYVTKPLKVDELAAALERARPA